MPHFHPFRLTLSLLLLALMLPALALAEPESPKAKIKKNPPPQTQAADQQKPQGSESAKEKKPPTPEEAGVLEVKGTVMKVFPERHALIVRTTSTDYQIFVTPDSKVTRDGKPVKIGGIHPGDRVDSCRFNAKRVIQKLVVAAPGKDNVVHPNPYKP